MGPLCPCSNSKKPMIKGTRGISWGPLLTPGPRAVPEFPNGQSAPDSTKFTYIANWIFSHLLNHSTYNSYFVYL
ncbi:unnamed protein product [Staurois parvus]|uniref:Cytochrome c oxidase subunit 1 n=1 Tax=Staurois parvus TaxID=386267 RepID=A0ABN9E8X7_9NEOB|nr:unnamed protein product [Staurois parvus]